MNHADLPLAAAAAAAATADEAAPPAVQTPAPPGKASRISVPPGSVKAKQRAYRPDADLVDKLLAFLEKHRPELADLARELEPQLRVEFGGGDHYVRAPSHDAKAAAGLAKVLAAFNGRNVSEVARELGLSRATVYRRLRQAGKR